MRTWTGNIAGLTLIATMTGCGSGGGRASARAESRRDEASATVDVAAAPLSVKVTPRVPVSDPHTTIVTEMRRVLVGTGTMDGAPITDVRSLSTCRTAFLTGGGATAIDWSKVGNVAPRVIDGREVNVLPGDGGDHMLSLPTGVSGSARDAADGISGAVGLLAADCGAVTS